ncbi:MAG: toll/interleukin-1 receptor domain-containing protein [Bacteroidota bacterium]
MQTFVSYASEDLKRVRRFVADLRIGGIDVWFDKDQLKPGSWRKQIEREIAKSRYFIICLSKAALRKTGDEPGFQEEELHQAYQIAQQQSPQSFTIIPVRLERCGWGDHRTSINQGFDLFPHWDEGLHRILHAIKPVSQRTEKDDFIFSVRGQAEGYFYAKDFEKALSLFETVAKLEEAETAYSARWETLCLNQLYRRNEALDKAEQWAQLDPHNCYPHHNRGIIYQSQGKSDDALAAFEKAEVLCGQDCVQLRLNQAIVLTTLQKYESAIGKLNLVLALPRLRPSFKIEALLTKAQCQLALDQKGEALRLLDAALSLIEKSSMYKGWYGLGCVLAKFGRYEDAVEAYKKDLDENSDHGEAWTNLGFALEALGRADDAQRAYERALDVTDVPYQAPTYYTGLLWRNRALLGTMSNQSRNYLIEYYKGTGVEEFDIYKAIVEAG